MPPRPGNRFGISATQHGLNELATDKQLAGRGALAGKKIVEKDDLRPMISDCDSGRSGPVIRG